MEWGKCFMDEEKVIEAIKTISEYCDSVSKCTDCKVEKWCLSIGDSFAPCDWNKQLDGNK